MKDISSKLSEIRDKLDAFYEDSSTPWGGGTGIDSIGPPMDSLTAVESLVKIEDVLGERIPISVVQIGGYNSKEEFVNGLCESIRGYFADKP